MSPVAQRKTDGYQALLLALQDTLGVVVGEGRHAAVLEKLGPVMTAHAIETIDVLTENLRDGVSAELRRNVLQAITSHDSEWQAYPEITGLLTDYVLPGVINKNQTDFRIWLVGCASGQIAYSLAMTIDAFRREYNLGCGIEIVATDISAAAVEQAEQGRYSESMLNDLPEHLRQKYMVRDGDDWVVESSLRSMLHFTTCDLLEGIETMGHFDLVICPDVLIYFSNGVKKRILEEFAEVLAPSGILLVGGNEAVTPFCNRFEMINHEAGTFYRQLPDA